MSFGGCSPLKNPGYAAETRKPSKKLKTISGRGVCNGDSGGGKFRIFIQFHCCFINFYLSKGLAVGSGSAKEIVGVASFVSAEGCEVKVPHVFTRVSGRNSNRTSLLFFLFIFLILEFVDWIDATVASN